MYLPTLITHLKVRGLSQTDAARLAGVSRQAVSHWFQSGQTSINLHSKSLSALAKGLGVRVEVLLSPLPILSDKAKREALEAEILWDKLYPDIESFIRALIRGHSPALARLVQIYGLFQSEKIAGRQVWTKFPIYRRLLPPRIREKGEILWNFRKNLT